MGRPGGPAVRGGPSGLTSWAAVLLVGLAATGPAAADLIHLVGGGVVEVDAWRDVGDAIEFTRGGGIVRIGKADISRIEGNTTSNDLRMRSAPAAAAPLPPGPRAAVRELLEVLRRGQEVIGQSGLTAEQKIEALKQLSQRWQTVTVADELRPAYTKGQRALQLGLEAYQAEVEGTAPDVAERVDQARSGLQEALADLRKAAGGEG